MVRNQMALPSEELRVAMGTKKEEKRPEGALLCSREGCVGRHVCLQDCI